MNEKIAKIFAAVCVVCAMIAMAACNSGGSDLPSTNLTAHKVRNMSAKFPKAIRSATHKLL